MCDFCIQSNEAQLHCPFLWSFMALNSDPCHAKPRRALSLATIRAGLALYSDSSNIPALNASMFLSSVVSVCVSF